MNDRPLSLPSTFSFLFTKYLSKSNTSNLQEEKKAACEWSPSLPSPVWLAHNLIAANSRELPSRSTTTHVAIGQNIWTCVYPFTDWYCYYDRENYSFEAFHISFFVSSFALPVIFNTILNVINVHHHSADIYNSCSKSIHMIDPILAWKHSDDSSIDQLMTSRKDSGLSIDWHTRIQWMYFSEH